MHRNDVLCARCVGHFQSLFGCAMIPNPRPIGSDWHDCDLKRAPRFDLSQSMRQRCIAGEKDRFTLASQDVAVITARLFARPPLTPVLYFDRFDLKVAAVVVVGRSFAPTKFGNVPKTVWCE